MKINLRKNRSPARTAFTLVELLVVISIVLILLALIVPPAGRILDAMSVTFGGQSIQNQLVLDRQLSLARNRAVEIRFYEMPEVVAAGQNRFTMYQSWIYDVNGVNPAPLDKIVKLPNGVILDAKPITAGVAAGTVCSSTLIDSAPHGGTQKIPSVGTADYKYRAFRFTGDGTTDLALTGTGNDTWFLTVKRSLDLATASVAPKNFYTIQVDPLTGQTQVFRP